MELQRPRHYTMETVNTISGKRRVIKDIIREEIGEHKSNLTQVKSRVEETFQNSFGTIDDAFIERTYIKCCARFWLQEATDCMRKLHEGKSRGVIQGIFDSLDEIQAFTQIPDPFNQLEYYTLLVDHYQLVGESDGRKFTSQFKNEFLEQMDACSDSGGKEFVFPEGTLDRLPEIEEAVQRVNGYAIAGTSVSTFTEHNVKVWAEEFRNSSGKEERLEELLAVIDRAVELRKGFKLHDTQKATIMTLMANRRSSQVQVATGEGKSLIVVAAAIMKVLTIGGGGKVDVVTSSSVLAELDAYNNRDIYNLFGITVSHNTYGTAERRKEAYSGNQVIYGDLSSFQRDYLLDKFYGINILGDRLFENSFIDEVDSYILFYTLSTECQEFMNQ